MLKVGSYVDNKYKVLAEVGHGGQSCVYLALNEKANKQWAIKEILNKEDTALITELSILKSLDNPHLPSIADIIETDNNLLVIMDYVEGITLRQKLKEDGPLTADEAVEYMSQICDVFTYLHTRKPPIIYRDLKPSNIMLKPDGTVVLIDFGAARKFKVTNIEDTSYLGTPGYAAPEQYGGEQTDARTDVYTVGTTLYHLLTGKPPHLATSKSIRDIDPALSSGLDAIIEKCTRPKKEERYQSCEELKKALLHYKDLESENIRRRRKHITFMCVTLLLSFLCFAGSLLLHSYEQTLKNENYDYYLRMAQSVSSDAISYYNEAIDLDPDNEEAYLLLLDYYLEDNEFSKDEADELVGILGYASESSSYTNELQLRTNQEGYDNFAFQLGLAYYYYYTNGKTMSEPWFEVAKESEYLTSGQIKRAQILCGIAGYYSELSNIDLAGDSEVSYATYWEDMTGFLDYDLVSEDNAKTAIVTYAEIAGQIITNAYEFKKAGVSQEEMEDVLSLIEKHIETDIDASSLSDANSELLSQLMGNIDTAKAMIVTTFQDVD